MLQLAFRSFFFIAVILGYSTGIWRLINDYFRHEFQSYLEQESKANKYILQDPPAATVASGRVESNQLQRRADAPHQRSPLLDEVILNVGRMFTDRGGAEGKTAPGGDHQKVTNSISEFSNPIVESSSSSTVTEREGTQGHQRKPSAGVGDWQERGVSQQASELQTGPESAPKMVAVSSGRKKAPIEIATAPVAIAAEAAEVTDIRPAPGDRKRCETTVGPEGDESEGDKWISYWQHREERQDIDASATIPFCSIGAHPSDENPSGALRPQGKAVAGGGGGGRGPAMCGDGGK